MGKAVSLQFIHKDYIENENKKKKEMKKGSKIEKELYAGIPIKDKKIIKEDLNKYDTIS